MHKHTKKHSFRTKCPPPTHTHTRSIPEECWRGLLQGFCCSAVCLSDKRGVTGLAACLPAAAWWHCWARAVNLPILLLPSWSCHSRRLPPSAADAPAALGWSGEGGGSFTSSHLSVKLLGLGQTCSNERPRPSSCAFVQLGLPLFTLCLYSFYSSSLWILHSPPSYPVLCLLTFICLAFMLLSRSPSFLGPPQFSPPVILLTALLQLIRIRIWKAKTESRKT